MRRESWDIIAIHQQITTTPTISERAARKTTKWQSGERESKVKQNEKKKKRTHRKKEEPRLSNRTNTPVSDAYFKWTL